MFSGYHSSKAELSNDDARVVVIGPQKLAEMVLDAGLAGSIVDKVSQPGAIAGPPSEDPYFPHGSV